MKVTIWGAIVSLASTLKLFIYSECHEQESVRRLAPDTYYWSSSGFESFDEIHSPCCFLGYSAAEVASEVFWKSSCVSVLLQILCYACFSDVNAHFSDVEVFFSDVNAIFPDVNLEKSDWDLSKEWITGFVTSIPVYFAL